MSPSDLAAIALPFAVAAAAIVVALLAPRRRRSVARQLLTESRGRIAVLFDGDEIEDATPEARGLLAHGPGAGSDREALLRLLVPRFPGLRDAFDRSGETGTERIAAAAGGSEWAEIDHWDGLTRLTLHGAAEAATGSGLSGLALAALEDELEMLRALGEDAPQLIWRQEADGTISWANRAFLAIEAQRTGRPADAPAPWPPEPLFDGLAPPQEPGERLDRRQALSIQGQPDLWFDITSLRRGAGSIHFAVDARAAVKVEEARRHFVQTLSKTFADLAIGLAIFDRDRQLVMFNPSLMDLTRLPIEFLAARPSIHAFLDRLRDQRMLPEPRHYRSWREEISALEAAAENGTYCELWSLSGGETYRVTGRPHPDGAIAFLIEDITAEMSLTRRFRSQIETAQAAFDTMPEAIAVFSPAGTLTLANAAYRALWRPETGTDLSETLQDLRLRDEIALWRRSCAPTEFWGEITATPGPEAGRAARSARVLREDGRMLQARHVPLPGGSALMGFAAARSDETASPRRQPAAPAAAPAAATG